jgi:hypothetical protein
VLALALITTIGLIAGLVASWLTHADGASPARAVSAGGRAFVAACMLGLAFLTALRL